MSSVSVSITIKGDSKDNDSTIRSWFKSLDSPEYTEWIEKVKTLESPNEPKRKPTGFIQK